jgi:branched-chain amino acid transport system substrate-binding protein
MRVPLLVIGLCAITVTACASSGGNSSSNSGGASGSYDISLIADASGPYSANGLPAVGGAQAAVRYINAHGGVNGHKLSLSQVIDAQSTTQGAQGAARQAIEQNPVAIVEQVISSSLPAQVPVFGSANTVVVTPTPLESVLLPKPAPWFFTTGTTAQQSGTYLVNALKSLLGGSLQGKRIALSGLDAPAVTDGFDVIRNLAKQDGFTIVKQTLTTGTIATFAGPAATLVNAKPDGIIMSDSAPNTVVAAKAIFDAGFTGPIVGNAGANGDATFRSIGSPDFYAVREVRQPVAGDVMMAAAQAAGVGDQVESQYFPKAWVAVFAIAAGLKACGYPCSAKDLLTAMNKLSSVSVAGNVLFGPLSYSADRHAGLSSVELYRLDSGASAATPVGGPIALSASGS